MNKLFVLLFLLMPSYVFCKITIVTSPIGSCNGGHKGVTRSLIDGFRKLNIDFNYGPKSFNEVGNVLIVLSDIQALKQGIQLKQQHKIKKLIVGPNLMVWSFEYDRILGSPEIDTCIVPSEWVKSAYEFDEPRLKGKTKVWYAGVDESYWNPNSVKAKNNNVLVYWKTGPESFCIDLETILKKYNWNPIRIRYGAYNAEYYKRQLSLCQFAVFISATESQGLALVESWSMNVPTLVMNGDGQLRCNNKVYPGGISACPYLTPLTGVQWKNKEEFEKIIEQIDELLCTFYPRKWVLEHMTDEKSAKLILSIVQ